MSFMTEQRRLHFWSGCLFDEAAYLARPPIWRGRLFGEAAYLARLPIWRGCLFGAAALTCARRRDIIDAMDTHTCHLKRFAGSEKYHISSPTKYTTAMLFYIERSVSD